jgi:hypothetical protein
MMRSEFVAARVGVTAQLRLARVLLDHASSR